MFNSIRRSAASAMFAIAIPLGLSGIASAVTITGGTTATVDGWEIAPQAGVTVTATDVAGVLELTKTVTFTTNDPVGVTFTQTGTAADSIQFNSESVTNSSGVDWNGFVFALTGNATFTSISSVFIPPFSSGVNYTNVQLNAQSTTLTYTGTQANGSTSSWGGLTSSDLILITASPAAIAPFASFSLSESPIAPSTPPTTPIPAPAAASVSLAGLLLVALRLAMVKSRTQRA